MDNIIYASIYYHDKNITGGRLLYSSVLSGVLHGIKAQIVRVEVDAGNGIPSFDMSGFLSNEVKEARERVRVAIRNSGYELPPQRIAVNISPADIRKCGTGFDLPIALAILSANGYIDEVNLDNMMILGELSLDGSINGVRGVLPCVCSAKEAGIDKVLLPEVNINEGNIVKKISVMTAANLKQAVKYINEGIASHRSTTNDENNYKADMKNPEMDYSDIKGQFAAKRATMIAVAGMHNIMYMGPPGSGKTMMAKRIPTIMPEMTFDEKLAVTNIYSVAGQLGDNGGLMEDRPFRAPYHNVTKGAFFGGGIVPRPGEITLAGKGVLFLDEMTEFKPDILEGLRQPLEDKNITIVRMNRAYTYPADFMLVGAMNPCKCGYFPDRNRCNCSEQDIKRFMGKISMPLWDRFDMCIKTEEIGYSELGNKIHQNDGEELNSFSMKEHIMKARTTQLERFKGMDIMYNSQMNGRNINKFCRLGDEESKLIEKIFAKKKLTARGYHKILKTARTIADIEGNEYITTSNISEAFYYRGIPEITVH